MPLEVPKIDGRTYQAILNEARARIPVHNPEWTNFNDSDPGITLLQLFSFMAESLAYRMNQIPERNRMKFLKLLGIPMSPAAPALGLVSFANPKGPLQTVVVEKNTELLAGQVPFQTRDRLVVLPIESQVYYKYPVSPERQAEMDTYALYESFKEPGAAVRYYETKLLEPPAAGTVFPSVNLTPGQDTMDGCLWLALLARPRTSVQSARVVIASQILTVGIMPAFTGAASVLQPGGPSSPVEQPALQFLLPVGGKLPQEKSQRVARYRVLDSSAIDTVLAEPGIVKLSLPGESELRLWDNFDPLEPGVGDFPPYVEDTDVQDRIITWIRIQMPESRPQSGAAGQLSAAFSWVGINAARVMQRVRVSNEQAGRGSGEPDQSVKLANTPVIAETLELTVNGETWTRVEDLWQAGSEVPVGEPLGGTKAISVASDKKNVTVYTLDRESGEVRFGDGERGARPPFGAVIMASYDFGGGRRGSVGLGAINKGAMLPAGIKVSNPIPTWGADEGETVEEAERHISRTLQHGNRLVTKGDFQDITGRTPGVDIARIDIVPLFHPQLDDASAEGVVTVMVIPRYDPVHADTPEPDRLFIDTICRHLDRHRLITTEIHVRGPEYVPLWVSVGIDVFSGEDLDAVREEVKKAMRTYLSPVEGGHAKKGWHLNTAVERLELMVAAARVKGVSKVVQVLLTDEGAEKDSIPMKGLQLPRLMAVAVQPGTPQSLAEMRGDVGVAPAGPPIKVIPVPMIPPECR